MPHENYIEEVRQTDRTIQGGYWAFGASGGFIAIMTVILFLSPPTNVYAIAGAYTVGGCGITLFSLGVMLRITGAAMTGGHRHYECLEGLLLEIMGRIAKIEQTLGMASSDDLAPRRRTSG